MPQQLPIAEDVRKLASDNGLNWALFGGDDYQLCFTVGDNKLETVEQWIESGELNASRIGSIEASATSGNLVTVLDINGNPLAVDKQGYDHFG